MNSTKRRLAPIGIAIGIGITAAWHASGCAPATTGSSPGAGPLGEEVDAGMSTSVSFDGDSCEGGTLSLPTFGPICKAGSALPPISGGTLFVTVDGHWAIVSDPDRDAVYVVNLTTDTLAFTIALQAGDEPGRIAEDAAGDIHVALRSGGALVTFDPTTGSVLARRAVCPAPRGVAYDAEHDTVWVACATGEVIELPAAGGAATTNWTVERDLRDIIVTAGVVTLSEFRSAQMISLAKDGSVATRQTLAAPDPSFVAHVLWRMIPGPNGTTVCVHQEHSTANISTRSTAGTPSPGAYGGCGGAGGFPSPPPFDAGFPATLPPFFAGTMSPLGSVLTIFGSDGAELLNAHFDGVLPVDVAASADGSTFAVATPGSAYTQSSASTVTRTGGQSPLPFPDFASVAIGVAFDSEGDILVQTRDPATLWIFPPASAGVDAAPAPIAIPLSTVSRCDSGHAIFHTHAGAAIACASCHPEGGDDGHTWQLDGNERRTPSLRGTIAGTAPYHWPGDEPDLPTLVNDVYTVRMAGQTLDAQEMTALTSYVQTIPAPPAPSWIDATAAAAGKVLFNRSDVGCSTCHSGAKFTNNATMDVGTRGAFQVPPLVGVGWRTPLLHTGCARTIADRFGSQCSTTQHGNIAGLSSTDITNLSAYLETL